MVSRPKRRHKTRAEQTSGLPKGFYRVPGGGITRDPTPAEQAGDVFVRPIAYEQPNIELLAKALIEAARQHGERRAAGECEDDCRLCELTKA